MDMYDNYHDNFYNHYGTDQDGTTRNLQPAIQGIYLIPTL